MSNRNASYSLFGWDFQINAAIFIFLKNIQDIDKIRLEGKFQDIEFIKKDKSRILAQAKAIYKWDDYSNVLHVLKSALISLNDAQQKEPQCNNVVYITNTPNPFKTDQAFFNGVTKVSYSELPDSCKAIIDKIKKDENLNDIQLDQLSIQVLPFHGDDKDNRYKYLKELVGEFLASIHLSDSGFTTQLLCVWQNEILHNGTIPDTSVHIEKSAMIWPLIFLVTDQANDDWLSQELDEIVYEEVKTKYRKIINNTIDRFNIYTKIVSDFKNYTFNGNNRDKVKSFINEGWKKYMEEIDVSLFSTEEQEYIIKIILHKILVKKEYISKIKIGVGL